MVNPNEQPNPHYAVPHSNPNITTVIDMDSTIPSILEPQDFTSMACDNLFETIPEIDTSADDTHPASA